MNTSSSTTQSEFFAASVLAVTTGICTNTIGFFTTMAATGAPISALISGITAVILMLLFTKKFPSTHGDNIINKAETSLGCTGKYGIGILLIIYLFLSSLYLLDQYSAFAKIISFPTAPIWFTALFFSTAALCGIKSGSVAILKICTIATPFFSVSLIIILISALKNCDINNIFPLWGTSVTNTFRTGIAGTVAFTDILLLFLFGPGENNRKTTSKAMLWGVISGIALVFTTILAFTARTENPLSTGQTFPLYLLSKDFNAGRFFQRPDGILLLVSSVYNMLGLSFRLWCLTKVIKQVFNIRLRPLTIIFPLSALFLLFQGKPHLPTVLLESTIAALCVALLIFSFVVAVSPRKEPNNNEN